MPDSLQVNSDTGTFSMLDYQLFLNEQDSNVDTFPYYRYQEVFVVNEPESVDRESLFTQHQLQKRSEPRPIPKKENSDIWIFGTLIGVAILFCWISVSYRMRVTQLFRACFSNRYMNILIKEGNLLKEIIVLPIIFAFLSLVALLIYKFIDEYSIAILQHNNYLLFLLILGSLIILCFLKLLIIKLIGSIFKMKLIAALYLVNDVVFALITAISLFLLLFLLFFLQFKIPYFATILTLGVLGFIYVFKIVRGFFLVLTSSKFSKLYLFYYLCTVEIFPILIIGKLLISSKS